MRSLLLDLICALRALRAAPAFACVAACTLALGIAFNVIIFSFVNAVLLAPLPYPDSERLVIIESRTPRRQQPLDLAAKMVLFLKQHATTFENVAASYPTDAGVNLSGPGRSRYVRVLRVSGNFFHTLGTEPIIGRDFSQQEEQPGAEHVAMISYSLWKTTLLHRRDLGGMWRINGEPYAVIGVMPETFRSYPDADLWLPLDLSSRQSDPGSNYRVIARVRRGATMEEGRSELQKLSRVAPFSPLQAAEHASLGLLPFDTYESQSLRSPLIFLLSAVFIVLLIASANIAMLLLVRVVARSHEIGVRLALGSSRRRLFQLFFFEGVAISLLGSIVGLILAKELLPFVLYVAPAGLSQLNGVHVDWRVVEFAGGVSAFTAVLFGLPIAIRLSRLRVNEMLAASNFRLTAGLVQTRAARLILVVQAAFTLVLLSGAILFFRHLESLSRIDPGFDTRHAAVAQVSLVGPTYDTAVGTAHVLERIVRYLEASTLVDGAATISALPLENGLNVPIYSEDSPRALENVEYRSITAGYFPAMGISLIEGREFSGSDGSQTQPVAIVNEMLARKWWPQGRATGHVIHTAKELGLEFSDRPRLIIGVVSNVHQSSLEQLARPTVFVPVAQVPDSITAYTNQRFLTSIVIRTPKPEEISEQVRNAIEIADPDLAVASYRPLSEVVRYSTRRDRFYTLLTTNAGLFALLITTIGLYGLITYQIALTSRDIAVRMSFGANRFHAVILILRQSFMLLTTAVLAGSAGCIFLIFLFGKLFYNNFQGFTDMALATVVLLLAAMLASLLGALRVSTIEPVVVLRNE